MNITDFTIDDDKATGVWIDFDKDEGVAFKLAYGNGKAFAAASARIGKRYPAHRIQADESLLHKMTTEVIAEAVIIDWRGLEDNGKPFPCTPENKAKLLKIDTFREWIATQSRDLRNYQAGATAEDAATLKSGGGVDDEVGG